MNPNKETTPTTVAVEVTNPIKTAPQQEVKVTAAPIVTVTPTPQEVSTDELKERTTMSAAMIEINKKIHTLPEETKAYLNLIEVAALAMSSGPYGEFMSLAEIHKKQAIIFGSVMRIFTDTPDAHFNLAMYALSAIFKRNSESRVGGFSPERALVGIGAIASETTPGVVNYNWIVGKTEEDISWYRALIVTMNTAHERGCTALKTISNVTQTVYKHGQLQMDKTKANRLQKWFETCNPL